MTSAKNKSLTKPACRTATSVTPKAATRGRRSSSACAPAARLTGSACGSLFPARPSPNRKRPCLSTEKKSGTSPAPQESGIQLASLAWATPAKKPTRPEPCCNGLAEQRRSGSKEVRSPTPVFFVSVASKEFSCAVSLLYATLAGRCISVAVKGLKGWGPANDVKAKEPARKRLNVCRLEG